MSKEQWIRNYEHHMAEIESRATDKDLKNPKKVEQMNQEAIKRTEEDCNNGECR